MAYCCLNNNLMVTSNCDAESAPGLQRLYIFNKKDVTGSTRDDCGGKDGYVNTLTLCEYKCGYIFEFETQTGRFMQVDSIQGQSNPTTLTVEGTAKVLNCTDQATLESLYGGEFTIITLDNAGVWRIAGHVSNLPGFRFQGLNFDSGAAATDTIVSTLTMTLSTTAKRGGWKLFLAGDVADSYAVRVSKTTDYINDLLCDPSGNDTCGCEPGE